MIFQIESALGIDFGVICLFFLIGILLIKWFAKELGWFSSLLNALFVQIPWLIISVFSIFFIFISESIYIDLILYAFLLFIGTMIVSALYEKNFISSFLFTLLIQVMLFALTNITKLLFNKYLDISLENDKQISGGIIMFNISLVLMLIITAFFSFWGNKVQLIKRKGLIAIISMTPSFFILSISYLIFFETFYFTFIKSGLWIDNRLWIERNCL